MTYVKANFRTKALDVQLQALGRNINNWLAGSGVNAIPENFQGGGLLVGSFSGLLSGGVAQISALDALTSAYGATFVSNIFGNASGFVYIPLGIVDVSGGLTSFTPAYRLSATQAASLADSIAIIVAMSNGVAVSASFHFYHFGFIVSAPFTFR